jgi:hypothetical protein
MSRKPQLTTMQELIALLRKRGDNHLIHLAAEIAAWEMSKHPLLNDIGAGSVLMMALREGLATWKSRMTREQTEFANELTNAIRGEGAENDVIVENRDL